ncbi:EAL domain-containing protein [Rhodoferax sp. UBA5149]|uniref:EAL domain-containing protein n=1 Tax=Rhodoferax sp. UBA5149 TaxID=1947379 RepID=UPI0025E31B92|nr:EAL domain-containing protein [Rhodoferax sp. UBA5149]
MPFLAYLRRLLLTLLLAIVGIPGQAAAPPSAIRVVLDDNYPPFSFRDSKGQVQGILKGLWGLWQQRTGVAVDFQAMDWAKARATMESGQADVIDTIFVTEERRKIYDFSRPYARIEVPIFFHRSITGITDVASLKGFTIDVKDGDACIDYLKAHGIAEFKRYASYEAQVKAAIRQEIRLFCIDKPPAFYFLNHERAADEFRYSPPLYVGEFHWAVAKGRTDLKQLVDEGFSRISAEERSAIESRWLGAALGDGFWPGVARYGGYALFAVALVIVILFLWNRTLRQQVVARTRELSATLRSLGESESRFRTLFEQANDAVFILRGSTVLDCNRQAEALNGIPRDKIIGAALMPASPPMQPDGQKSGDVLRDMLAKADAGHAAVFEWRDLRPDGSLLDVEVSLSRVDFGGEPCLQAIVRDITARKKAEEKIKELAFFDQLTGLPNRTLLLDRLGQLIAASSRSGNYGAMLFIDLDNFKILNDTLGHDMGDLLLTQVAQRLSLCVRDGDTVARFGGDEFVVVVAGLNSDKEEAATNIEGVAEKILAALNQTYQLGDVAQRSTASIGVTVFRGDQVTIDQLMKQADLALYKSKGAGRNLIHFFDPTLESAVKERSALEKDLRYALEERHFLLHYQAQIGGDGRVTGAEALVRWQHPQYGIVSPAEFIPLAEETGLILPLGHWVLETACMQLAKWATQPAMAHFTIAVNVSAHQFRQPGFVDQVLTVLKNSGANPQRLKLELTESLLVSNLQEVVEKMFTLKAQGVGFSLDDFGTGYSSLSYLKRLPLDYLKIDRSFVQDVLNHPNDAAIAKTIITLAQNLGMGVIAEGVETAAQRDFLARSGCFSYQGFLFSRPLPLEDFKQFSRQI